jgi:hypothetical protein
MTQAVRLGRDAAWLLMCSLVATGCSGCSFDLGDPIDSECIFHDPISQGIDSDNQLLQADVDCEDGVACTSDRRTILRGTKLEYEIRVPADRATTQLHVASSDERVLAVTFDRIDDDPCDGAMFLYGSAEFREIGEAALIVYDGEDEVDRYTTTTHEADRLELFLLQGDAGPPIQALAFEDPLLLGLAVVNEAGEPLVGAHDTSWSIDDYGIARISDDATPASWAFIEPVAVGMTTLRVRSTSLTLEVPLEVTGSPDGDAGSDDAGE